MSDTSEFCGNCDTEFEPTAAQRRQVKKGKRVYCSTSCKNARISGSRDARPWAWLKVPHLLDNLPAYSEPTDNYVGY